MSSRRSATLRFEVVDGQIVGTLLIRDRDPIHFSDADELNRVVLELITTGAQASSIPTATSCDERVRSSSCSRLTSTERRVARQASTGASNRQIAQELYYSVKSVEAYLTRIYRKLGVKGRTEMAALLRQSGQHIAP